MTDIALTGNVATQALKKRHLRPVEFLPLLAVCAAPIFGEQYLPLATQIAIFIIFCLSLDLLVGFGGIVTIGHSVFFGLGAYTSGILSANGYGDPLTGLAAGAAVAAVASLALGAIVLRVHGFTLLMLTLCSVFLMQEIANKATDLTGGIDGLVGVSTQPLLGIFEFDLWGKTGFGYSVAVLAVVFLAVRLLMATPFGLSIVAIRDNRLRASMVGIPVGSRQLALYVIAGLLAGVAGALQSQITQFVSINAIGFELSGEILIMLALGGAGRIYGAFFGPIVYLIAQDIFSKFDPAFWHFWLGTMIVVVVLFAPGGLVGLASHLGKSSIVRKLMSEKEK
ncbi:branched-chain amino acid ABC transporter permease [Roseibium sp. SCP14]|uniref:branched-chain amino acid ABC transporter permease n=1 Tax=Roseibium sp. SCP14 TaxID=3141375 RepID=UPI00333BF77B